MLDTQKNKLSFGILANESSRRTTQNKALFKIGDQTFIEKLAEEFGNPIISASSKNSYPNLNVIEDEHHGIGPMEGIRQILKTADTEYVFITGADMPFVTKELSNYLKEYISSDYDCYLFTHKGKTQTMAGIYSKAMLPAIEELIAEEKYCLLDIYDKVRTKYINYIFDEKLLTNINTEEDYKRMHFPIIFCVCGTKNTGKTTLTTRLIEHFSKTYTVNAIKHDAHGYVMDYPGKDSCQMSEAGADIVSIYNDDKYSINAAHPPKIEKLIEWQANQCDILIIEGWKKSPYPKLEVTRGGELVIENPILVTDAMADIEKIASKILEHFNVL